MRGVVKDVGGWPIVANDSETLVKCPPKVTNEYRSITILILSGENAALGDNSYRWIGKGKVVTFVPLLVMDAVGSRASREQSIQEKMQLDVSLRTSPDLI